MAQAEAQAKAAEEAEKRALLAMKEEAERVRIATEQKARMAEQERHAEQARLAEQARQAEETRQAEDRRRRAEQARRAEEEQRQAAKEQQRQRAQAEAAAAAAAKELEHQRALMAEETRRVEQERIAEAERLSEQAQLAGEQLAQDLRAEQERLASLLEIHPVEADEEPVSEEPVSEELESEELESEELAHKDAVYMPSGVTSLRDSHKIIEPAAATNNQTIVIEPIPQPGLGRKSKAAAATFIFTAAAFTGVGLLLGTRSTQQQSPTTPSTAISSNSTVTTAPVDDTSPLGSGAPSAPLVTAPQPAPTTQTTQAPSPSSTPTTAALAPASGNTITRLSGSSNRQSALFDLPQGPVSIRYNSTGGNLTVHLVTQSGKDTGDTFTCSSACDRQADLVKDAGKYYLDVESSGGDWNIQVSS